MLHDPVNNLRYYLEILHVFLWSLNGEICMGDCHSTMTSESKSIVALENKKIRFLNKIVQKN
jgi:hypothetical protein